MCAHMFNSRCTITRLGPSTIAMLASLTPVAHAIAAQVPERDLLKDLVEITSDSAGHTREGAAAMQKRLIVGPTSNNERKTNSTDPEVAEIRPSGMPSFQLLNDYFHPCRVATR